MSRYSKTPASSFMEMPLEEFAEWVTVVSKEMKREAKAIEEARRKARKK